MFTKSAPRQGQWKKWVDAIFPRLFPSSLSCRKFRGTEKKGKRGRARKSTEEKGKGGGQGKVLRKKGKEEGKEKVSERKKGNEKGV